MKTIALKALIAFSVLFLFTKGHAQDGIATIKDVPIEGVKLSGEWKFRNGDNVNWSQLGFNDSNWKTIDPSQDVKLVSEVWQSDICWIRLHFIPDSSLLSKSLVLKIDQSIASEIYLNGEFIGKYGSVKNGDNKVIAVSPLRASFIGFPLKNTGENVLTVRFSLQKDFHYTQFAGRPNTLFNATIIDVSNIDSVIASRNIMYYHFLRVGIFLILTILHLGLYFHDKTQKSNLYFSLFSLLLIISNFIDGMAYWYIPELETKLFHLSYALPFQNLAYLVLLLAIYDVYSQRKTVIFWMISLFTLGTIIVPFVIYETGNSAAFILSIIVSLDIIRTSSQAYKAKHSGALIILISGLVLLLSFLAFYLCVYGILNSGHNFMFGHFYFNLGLICLPIGISLYLALEASRKSKSLKVKIGEVEKLSLEKEDILTSQNEELEKQVTERTSELSQSLSNLKSTQAQLIQSEKMASLGELTAGIAHEIQNPLNFVNNFSEVSEEMIEEVLGERLKVKGERDEALEEEILKDIKENLTKIHHHGNRASSIVKGMLEHSRTSSGKKELTDINALADEYLRLSYHASLSGRQGLRAKDRNFNAEMVTNFDPTLPKIDVIPQDIGRVLLNLINNAFQAVDEQAKKGIEGYKPTVSLKTELKANGSMLIAITDNGPGIPDAIKDKIFQPFFTTKPTGKGTGLGLSLAFDIVKAHGGELTVESEVGKETEFIISLPINIKS